MSKLDALLQPLAGWLQGMTRTKTILTASRTDFYNAASDILFMASKC